MRIKYFVPFDRLMSLICNIPPNIYFLDRYNGYNAIQHNPHDWTIVRDDCYDAPYACE